MTADAPLDLRSRLMAHGGLKILLTVVIALGIGGLIMGAAHIIRGIRGDGWGAAILGVVSILLGAALLANRLFFTFSLPLVVGTIAIAGGYTFRAKQDIVYVVRAGDPEDDEIRLPVSDRVEPGDIIRVDERMF